MLSDMDISVQINATSAQLKNKSKSEFFREAIYAHESAKRTTTNAFGARLMLQFRVHLIIHLELYLKVHFKNAPKRALQVALGLHLFVQLSMHKSIPNDSIKGKIEDTCYSTLEGASKISF